MIDHNYCVVTESRDCEMDDMKTEVSPPSVRQSNVYEVSATFPQIDVEN